MSDVQITDQTRLPDDHKVDAGEVMTNFDHAIDDRVARRLEHEDVSARYSAWNFNGMVWFDKTSRAYRCEVWQYRVYMGTVSGSLTEIMEQVSAQYGYD